MSQRVINHLLGGMMFVLIVCRLGPCIIARPPPTWFFGSSPPGLNNFVKRFKFYKTFWTLLGQLGVWNDPVYLALKVTKTSITDRRDVMPHCVTTVRQFI